MGNGNRSSVVLAIICVGMVHAGAFMGLTSFGNRVEMVMQEGGATQLTMHRFQLAGIEEEQEGNAEESAPELESEIPEAEMTPDPEPEPEITPEPEPTPPEPEPEPKPKPKPEPEPVKKPEPPKEEVIAAKKRAEHKARKMREREQMERREPQRRPEKRHERRPERRDQKPTHRPKPQGNAPARAAQTAKAVYSEHEVSVLSKPMPGYPRAARQRRMQGTVALLVNINAGGTVSSVAIQRSSGHELLDREAAKAAHGIRLRPYLVNGVPTPIRVRIQYQFKM